MSPIEEIARGRYWRESEARLLVRAWQTSGLPITRFAVSDQPTPA